jgi:thioredoxin 1
MGNLTFEVNDANFQKDVLESDKPVLVDFWAEWCGPCKAIAPLVEQIASEYSGSLRVAKMDADENLGVVQQFQIMSIPTLILFKNGKVVERITGYQAKEKITAKLVPHIG